MDPVVEPARFRQIVALTQRKRRGGLQSRLPLPLPNQQAVASEHQGISSHACWVGRKANVDRPARFENCSGPHPLPELIGPCWNAGGPILDGPTRMAGTSVEQPRQSVFGRE